MKSKGSAHYRAIRVLCIDTGEVFPCRADAARTIGRGPMSLQRAVNKTANCAGMRWKDVPPHLEGNELREWVDAERASYRRSTKGELISSAVPKRRVLCVDTGVVYASTTEASRRTGVQQTKISSAALGKRKSAGDLLWRYVPEGLDEEDLQAWICAEQKKPRPAIGYHAMAQSQGLRTLCVDTGEVFDSMQAAARAKNIMQAHLFGATRGRRISAGGMLWRLVPKNLKGQKLQEWIKSEQTKPRPLMGAAARGAKKAIPYLIVESGQVFASGRDCAKAIGANEQLVYSAAVRRGTVFGQHVRRLRRGMSEEELQAYVAELKEEIGKKDVPRFYVYVHRRRDTEVIFYVGKGSGSRRLDSHHRSDQWKQIVKEAGGFYAEIVEEKLTPQEAGAHEKRLIARYRDHGLDLANRSQGGEGLGHGIGTRVLCCELGAVFDTIVEAKAVLGVTDISAALRRRTSAAGGFTWIEVPHSLGGDELEQWVRAELSKPAPLARTAAAPRGNSKRCLDPKTGRIYESYKACAKALGSTLARVADVIRGESLSVSGQRIVGVPKGLEGEQLKRFVEKQMKLGCEPQRKSTDVVCLDVDSGAIYPNIREASKALGVHYSWISVATSKGRPVGGRRLIRVPSSLTGRALERFILRARQSTSERSLE